MDTNVQINKMVYPELSYKIVGILFDIHNQIGGGHKEKYVQKAIEIALKENKLEYQKELHCPLRYNGQEIGKYYLDFFIEGKVILEVKVGERFKKEYIDQVLAYLKTNNLKLGIIANFTRDKLNFRRILNLR